MATTTRGPPARNAAMASRAVCKSRARTPVSHSSSKAFGVAMVAETLDEIRCAHGDLEAPRRVHELVRRLITQMIEDVIAESGRRLAALAPASAADIRAAAAPVVAFSDARAAADREIKGFLYPRMYRHPRVLRIMGEAEGVVCHLTSLVLVDEAGERHEGLPAARKVALAAPRVAAPAKLYSLADDD